MSFLVGLGGGRVEEQKIGIVEILFQPLDVDRFPLLHPPPSAAAPGPDSLRRQEGRSEILSEVFASVLLL
jgi:hypothetical protein